MPCYDGRDDELPDVDERRHAYEAATLLCALLKALETKTFLSGDMNKRLDAWWTKHKEEDEKYGKTSDT